MEASKPVDPAPSRWGNSGWSLANTLCAMLASFAGFLLASRWLGTEEIGRLAIVGAALFPLRFAELGLTGAVMRYVGAYDGRQQRRFVGQIVRLSWVVSLAAAATMLALCALLTPALLKSTIGIVHQPNIWLLVILLVATSLVQLTAAPLYGTLLGLQRFRLVYMAGALISLAQLAAVVPLILRFGIAGLVMGQLLVQVASLLVYLPALAGLRNASDEPEPGLDKRAFLGFTFQFSLNSVLTTLLEPVAKLIIGSSTSLSLLGVFEVLWRIFVQLRTMLIAPLNPLGIEMIALWRDDHVQLQARYRVIMLFSLIGAAALLAASVPVHIAFSMVAANGQGSNAWVAASVSLAMALGFLMAPTYFLSLAANEVRPIIAGTLCNLGIQLIAKAFMPGWLDWHAVFGVFVSAFAMALVVQAVLVRYFLRFPVLVSPGALLVEARTLFKALQQRFRGSQAAH